MTHFLHFPRLCKSISFKQFVSNNQKYQFVRKMSSGGFSFENLVTKLHEIAPLHLAESWDNVGLLVEPSRSSTRKVNNLLITNDLTEKVVEEAINKNVDFIISYHPPIFSPLKKLCNKNWKEKIVIKCIENKIGIYSPHTALDAVSNGVNDWLINSLDVENITPIMKSTTKSDNTRILIKFETDKYKYVADVRDFLTQYEIPFKEYRVSNGLEMACDLKTQDYHNILDDIENQFGLTLDVKVIRTDGIPSKNIGMGRIANLKAPMKLVDAVESIKSYIGMQHVRLAIANCHKIDSQIKRFAVCAGSGSSVLREINAADLILTGEMSHHDVLDFVHKGTSVVLCEHSNSERGYLSILKRKLEGNSFNVILSTEDSDPLVVV